MSNYVKSTNFAVKDTLITGDPDKKIKGTEIDAEYNNIATAVNSKANITSPTFTGTPTAPTAIAGTNTTQLATTAFATTALQACYPVGSIYMNATVSTNPGTLLGFGTWSAFGAGRVMVGLDAGNAAFDTVEKTGGSANAIVVSHTHTATSTSTVTDPGHLHNTSGGESGSYQSGGAYGASNDKNNNFYGVTNSKTTGITVATSTTNSTEGSSGTNANLQPYITVYMWKRTA